MSAAQSQEESFCGGGCSGVRVPPARAPTVDEEEEDEAIPEWDVCRGTIKRTPLERLSMVPPAMVRAAGNVVGGTLAAGGYAVGKASTAVLGGQAVDSRPFKAGAKAWMYANGILPEVVYEPLKTADAADAAAGQRNKDDPALTPVLVSNHTCYMDGLILAVEFGAPRIVATSGSKDAPVVGTLMQEMDVIFVDREDSNSRQATLDAINEHCHTWAPGKRPLLVFPEGKTTNGEALLPFKKGAFAAGLPVRPVIMVYTGQWDPACCTYRETEDGEKIEVSGEEWGKQFLGHLVHSVHIRVLAPYEPSAAERADARLYADNVREHMSAALIRVREELRMASWKEAAGRESGGLGYTLGDESRYAAQQAAQRASDAAQRARDMGGGCLGRATPRGFSAPFEGAFEPCTTR